MDGFPSEDRSSGPHHWSLRESRYRATSITTPHELRHGDSIRFFINGDLKRLKLPLGGSESIDRDRLRGNVILDLLQVKPESLPYRFRIRLLDRPDEIEVRNRLTLWHVVTRKVALL